eukprot:10043116-Alexandrium_andersonii.AAC.1
MSDIAAGGAWWLSASSVAGRAPANAGSAQPDSSPDSPWTGAARAGTGPPPEEEATSGRGTTAAAASTRLCASRAKRSSTRSSARATLASPAARSMLSNRARRSSE